MKIAVVIPCYKVEKHILAVIDHIPDTVSTIYCVDDACPNQSGQLIENKADKKRVRIIKHEINKGVGGAMISGYKAAIKDGANIVVKLDGDGQMDPTLIERFIEPIENGECDYTKGNRFFYINDVKKMPRLRLFGNAILSFMTKLSSGYWNLFDPTNGYTAVHTSLLKNIDLDKIDNRYFFESDMLFRLNLAKANVQDIPMKAIYDDEESNLKISKIILPFLYKHTRNTIKRIGYNYFLRDFSVASIEIMIALPLILFGIIFGFSKWIESTYTGEVASAGTVMLSALPILIGLQFLLSFLNYDIHQTPKNPIHKKLK